MSPLFWILLGAYWLVLAAAALSDLRSLRISNRLVLCTLVAAFALLLVREPLAPWWHYPASFLIALAVGFGLFSAGWLGGGDAKLAAAAALLFDLRELAWFAIATALAGGALTMLLLVLRKLRRSEGEGGRWLGLTRGRSIPYGVAIAIGAILVSTTAINT